MIPNSKLYRIQELTIEKNVPYHNHPHLEIVHVLKGKCEIEIPSLNWKRTGIAGNTYVLPGKKDHNQINLKTTTTLYWICDTNIFNTHKPELISMSNQSVKIKLLKKWTKELFQLKELNTPETILNSHLNSIMELLKQEISPLEKFSQSIQNAIDYQKNHFLKPITNIKLAKIACLSESHFLARFKKEVGISPTQFQIELKFRKAKDLLKDPYLSIKEIAIQCGYEDINYFGRLFRKHFKLSPGQWRKKYLGNNH